MSCNKPPKGPITFAYYPNDVDRWVDKYKVSARQVLKGHPAAQIEGLALGCWLVLKRAGSIGSASTWFCQASCCGAERILSITQLRRKPKRCQKCSRLYTGARVREAYSKLPERLLVIDESRVPVDVATRIKKASEI